MTTIYSPFPADCLWPSVANEVHCSRASRENYPALPWQMEELIGTTWRNLYNGRLLVIEVVRQQFGCDSGPSPLGTAHPEILTRDSIGIWSVGRFVIEHWVRVDHLDHDAQQRWAQVELRHNWREAHEGRVPASELQGKLF